MKKRITAALCALALLLTLSPAPARAAWDDDLTFIAVNVKLLALSDFMPIKVNGTVYVPITVFDSNANGGVKLGIFNGGLNTGTNTYTLYSSSVKNLVFDLNTGLSYDYYPDGVQQSCRSVVRNGKIYVTAYSVAQYFNDVIDCTFSANTGYKYPLVRIKSKNSALYADSDFINSAKSSAMLNVLNEYYKLVEPQAPEPTAPPVATPTPTPANPVPTPTPAPGEVSHGDIAVHLAIRMDTGVNSVAVLDTLQSEGRVALLLFPVESLAARDDLIRRALGEGHSLGLLVPGATADEARAALRRGDELLSRIAHLRTRMILPEGADASVIEALTADGFLCWQENINGVPGRRSGAATANEVMKAAERKRTLACITLDDSAAGAAALSRILRTVREEKYNYRAMVETEF